MRKRRKVIAAFAIAGVLVVAFRVFRITAEPQYNGHRLSYWLEIFDRAVAVDGPNANQEMELHRQAADALNNIGTNACPFVVSFIQHEPPAPIVALAKRRHFQFLNRLLEQDRERKQQAYTYFLWKQERAAPAIPMLSNTVVQARANSRAEHYALACLVLTGRGGRMTIAKIMENRNHPMPVRLECLRTIVAEYSDLSPKAQSEIDELRQPIMRFYADADPILRAEVTTIFRQVAPGLLH